jgi:hypothetical protein
MKATIDLDPDLYTAAERMAQSQRKSLAQVVSDLLRQALGLAPSPGKLDVAELERRNGFAVFTERSAPPVTVEIVRQICAEEAI